MRLFRMIGARDAARWFLTNGLARSLKPLSR